MTYNFYIDPIRRTVTPEAMTVLWLDQDVTTIHFSVEDFEGFTFDGSSILIKAVLPDRTQVEITPENFSTEPITTEDDEGQTVITGYSTSFDWTLTLEHTKAVGLLTYSICAIVLNLDGETVDKEWHTLNDSFQIRDHIHFNGSDDQDDPVTAATNAEKIAALKAQVDGLAGGVKTAGAVSQMTDHSVAYVYTGSETGYTRGNWYYWNGSAWVSGGAYGGAVTDTSLTQSGIAADAKAVGDAMAGIGAASVPTEVRQAMKTLFQKAAYIEEGLADEVAVITAWAEATTSVTVSPATASVSSASPTAQLSAVTTPAGKAVTWSSSNTAVATVSSTGLVTGVGNGTCTITATSGAMSASCAVTVTGFVMYSVSNTLTNCTSNNAVAQIAGGAAYTATLTPEEGRKFGSGSVTVTMGGVDVTSTVYSNGSISIASVTGDVAITAYANEFVIDIIGGIVDYDTTWAFRYTYDNTSFKTRRTMNPCAIKLVNGRSYTFSIGSLWGAMLCGVRVLSGDASTVEELDFSVTQGTITNFYDIDTSVYASGWLSEDYTYTADADGQIFAVTIKKSDGSNFSDANTASLLASISFVESM